MVFHERFHNEPPPLSPVKKALAFSLLSSLSNDISASSTPNVGSAGEKRRNRSRGENYRLVGSGAGARRGEDL